MFYTAMQRAIKSEKEAKLALEEVKKLNNEQIENGFASVFELAQSGRLGKADDKLALLAASSKDQRRIRLYKDIVKLFGNDEQRRDARDDLIELERVDDDLQVKSMLTLSYIRTGDEWSYHDKVAELFGLQPSTYEEHLFRGAAFIFAHPADARDDLQHAVRMNPDSSAAHILLSQALQVNAMERKHTDEELLLLARECHTEAMVGSRTSAPENINASIASLDAHCTLFLSLQQVVAAQELVDDCLHSWGSELTKSFQLNYDPQLHRAWLDSYRILLRHEAPLAQEIEEVVLRDPPKGSGDAREVIIKLIQLHLLQREDGKALRLAKLNLKEIGDYDLLAILPVLNSHFLQHGMDDAKTVALDVLHRQSPHPVASSLNWRLLVLLQEKDKAKLEAEAFRDFCRGRPQDRRAPDALRIASWMIDPVQNPIAPVDFSDSVYESHFRAVQLFNEAMLLFASDKRGEAVGRLEATRDSPAFRPFINAWAEVFLERRDDRAFLPWLEGGHGQQQER